MPILEARGVRFLNIINYPDISIQANKTTFVSGDSGSGKSTLLKLFNATESASGGTILYKGQDIEQLDTVQLRKEVLLVSQATYLFDKTIAENFAQFYAYRGQTAPNERRIKECLELCRANFPLDAQTGTMSGGERQRVYIAIYLSFQPEVLMLDEPTSALDAEHAGQMLENLKQYCKNNQMTLVVISHDQALVEKYADDVVRLQGGREDE